MRSRGTDYLITACRESRTSPRPGRGRRGAGQGRRVAPRGAPAATVRRLDDLQAARQQVVDRAGRGRRRRGRSARAARRTPRGSPAGRRLRSPPKSSGASPAHSVAARAARSTSSVGQSRAGGWRAGVQVGDAELRAAAARRATRVKAIARRSERPVVDRQLAPLDDLRSVFRSSFSVFSTDKEDRNGCAPGSGSSRPRRRRSDRG